MMLQVDGTDGKATRVEERKTDPVVAGLDRDRVARVKERN
jgi:hypothetical protein